MDQFYDISLIIDIAALAILVISAIIYATSGFLSAIVDLIGTLVSLVVSFFLGKFLSVWAFETLFRPSMHTNIMQVLEKNNITDVMEGIKEVLSFLPDGIIDMLSENVTPMLGESADAITTQILDQVVAPAVVPIIMFVLFVIIFAISMALVGTLSKVLKKTKKIPVIGAANTALGAATGVVIGAMFVFVLGFILWVIASANGKPVFTQLEFGNSIVYRIISSFKWLQK